jgi:hypothetical protein
MLHNDQSIKRKKKTGHANSENKRKFSSSLLLVGKKNDVFITNVCAKILIVNAITVVN